MSSGKDDDNRKFKNHEEAKNVQTNGEPAYPSEPLSVPSSFPSTYLNVLQQQQPQPRLSQFQEAAPVLERVSSLSSWINEDSMDSPTTTSFNSTTVPFLSATLPSTTIDTNVASSSPSFTATPTQTHPHPHPSTLSDIPTPSHGQTQHTQTAPTRSVSFPVFPDVIPQQSSTNLPSEHHPSFMQTVSDRTMSGTNGDNSLATGGIMDYPYQLPPEPRSAPALLSSSSILSSGESTGGHSAALSDSPLSESLTADLLSQYAIDLNWSDQTMTSALSPPGMVSEFQGQYTEQDIKETKGSIRSPMMKAEDFVVQGGSGLPGRRMTETIVYEPPMRANYVHDEEQRRLSEPTVNLRNINDTPSTLTLEKGIQPPFAATATTSPSAATTITTPSAATTTTTPAATTTTTTTSTTKSQLTFVNLTKDDAEKILSGVAPSGSPKRKKK